MKALRRFYASEIAAVSGVREKRLIASFALVCKERFFPPGPWLVPYPNLEQPGQIDFRPTASGAPDELYHNIVIALDADRHILSGQPSALAFLLNVLALTPGDRVVHIGSGTGYYTAIIAECVGASGSIVGVELSTAFANSARSALAIFPQARIADSDGMTFCPHESTAIFVNIGVTHLAREWLDGLAIGGRLVVPFTAARRGFGARGILARITRTPRGYAFAYCGEIALHPSLTGRDEDANERLFDAIQLGRVRSVRSVRRDTHRQGPSCWMHIDGACLSTVAP